MIGIVSNDVILSKAWDSCRLGRTELFARPDY